MRRVDYLYALVMHKPCPAVHAARRDFVGFQGYPHSAALACRLARHEIDDGHRASHPRAVNQYTAAWRGDRADGVDASGE
jgi:hypothetical protein